MITKAKTIKIKYFASLREQAKKDDETLTTEAPNAEGLYELLQRKYQFSLPKENVGVAINGKVRSLNVALSCGDTVVFIPPVSGG